MKITDIPFEKSERCPERLTVAISTTSYQKLEKIKEIKNKKPAILVRELIEEFLEKNKDFFESQTAS